MDTDDGRRMKVVCRYQQYRAVRKIVERLRAGKDTGRRSGVVWHTQGSGKSLTMVFVARMLRRCETCGTSRSSWSTTASTWRSNSPGPRGSSAARVVIESTDELHELATASSDVNMVMVHKFMDATRGCPTTWRPSPEALPALAPKSREEPAGQMPAADER